MISYYGALKLADKDLDLLVRYFHFHNSPAAVPRPCRNDGSSRKQLLKIKGRKIMHSSPLLNPWGKIKRVAFLFVSVFSGLGLSFSLARALSREGRRHRNFSLLSRTTYSRYTGSSRTHREEPGRGECHGAKRPERKERESNQFGEIERGFTSAILDARKVCFFLTSLGEFAAKLEGNCDLNHSTCPVRSLNCRLCKAGSALLPDGSLFYFWGTILFRRCCP